MLGSRDGRWGDAPPSCSHFKPLRPSMFLGVVLLRGGCFPIIPKELLYCLGVCHPVLWFHGRYSPGPWGHCDKANQPAGFCKAVDPPSWRRSSPSDSDSLLLKRISSYLVLDYVRVDGRKSFLRLHLCEFDIFAVGVVSRRARHSARRARPRCLVALVRALSRFRGRPHGLGFAPAPPRVIVLVTIGGVIPRLARSVAAVGLARNRAESSRVRIGLKDLKQ